MENTEKAKQKTAAIRLWDVFCVIELIINFIIIGLLFDQHIFGHSEHFLTNQFCYGATFGMILVILPLLFGLCTGDPRPKRTGLFVALSGALTFLGAGIFMIKEVLVQVRHVYDTNKFYQLMAGAAFTLILGVIFLIHFLTVLTLLVQRKEPHNGSVRI